MHRIVRSEPKIMAAAPSGHKGYIVLRNRPGTNLFAVTDSPFKEVPVHNDIDAALESAQDGEYVVAIDLPQIEE